MALPITIPYTFANATTSIPLSNLDSDFATVVNTINGIGNGTVGLTTITSPAGTPLTVQSAGTTAMTIDTSQNATFSNTVAMAYSFKRNIIINGNFLINQRGYVSGAATASGSYMHDRWKSTTTSSNYTFTQGTPDTTITIAAGTIAQIVEDKNVVGGVYTLSWTGTTTARIAINGGTTSGSYAASPITTSSATAGQTITVEFSTGTLGKVQLELGTIATPYERQIYSDQLAQCQRYFEKSYSQTQALGTVDETSATWASVNTSDATLATMQQTYKVTKRTTPTIVVYNTATGATGTFIYGASTATVSAVPTGDSIMGRIYATASMTSGIYLRFHWTASAEL